MTIRKILFVVMSLVLSLTFLGSASAQPDDGFAESIPDVGGGSPPPSGRSGRSAPRTPEGTRSCDEACAPGAPGSSRVASAHQSSASARTLSAIPAPSATRLPAFPTTTARPR